jgi:endo-1,4-beta-xylanase
MQYAQATQLKMPSIAAFLKEARFKIWRIVAVVTMGLGVGAALHIMAPQSNNAVVPVTAVQQKKQFSESVNLLEYPVAIPGTTLTPEGLQVNHVGFSIVNQDGSPGGNNSPINIFGARIQHSGSFTATATTGQHDAPASLQLYGELPIIADEFRIERKSLSIVADDGALRVSVWNGSQQPSAEYTFAYQPESPTKLAIEVQNDSVKLLANDTLLGEFAAQGIFKTGTLWYGVDGRDGAWTLQRLDIAPAQGQQLTLVDGSAQQVGVAAKGMQTLAQAKRPGFTMGAAMALGPAVGDEQYATVAFGGNFGSLTPENAMKMQSLHPTPATYDFTEADALAALAVRHNMVVHGHALVFGEANPSWVQDLPTDTPAAKEHVQQVMLDHIATVAGHYKGKVASWDVVNEPLADEGGLRNHKWYQAMGESYISQAFHSARQADPNAKLFINEYGLESGDTDRWNDFVALVTRLKNAGVPIDGVGMQSHIYERGDRINTNTLRSRIKQLAGLGLTTRISEIDVYSGDGSRVQSDQYVNVLKTCISEPSCVSYTTWGISDRYNWWQDEGEILQGTDFLWAADMRPRPAQQKIQQYLQSR